MGRRRFPVGLVFADIAPHLKREVGASFCRLTRPRTRREIDGVPEMRFIVIP